MVDGEIGLGRTVRLVWFGLGTSMEDFKASSPQVFGNLSPEAFSYIQRLQSALSNAKEELDAQKQENMQMEYTKEHRNDLLDYLRSMDSNMVTELSLPSSLEVEEIIHQLVQNISKRSFKELATENREILPDVDDEVCKE